MSVSKLKILSDRTSPFAFFFWEQLARVGRDHSTTVLSSVTQVGFKRWPRDKMAFRHWVLFTKRKLFGHFFPACWYRILTSSENLWQNQTRVKSICCGGGLKKLISPIFLKEKAFATCGLSGSFYPFSAIWLALSSVIYSRITSGSKSHHFCFKSHHSRPILYHICVGYKMRRIVLVFTWRH